MFNFIHAQNYYLMYTTIFFKSCTTFLADIEYTMEIVPTLTFAVIIQDWEEEKRIPQTHDSKINLLH